MKLLIKIHQIKGGYIKDSVWIQKVCMNRDYGDIFLHISGDGKKKKQGWWYFIKHLKFLYGKGEKVGIILIQMNLYSVDLS